MLNRWIQSGEELLDRRWLVRGFSMSAHRLQCFALFCQVRISWTTGGSGHFIKEQIGQHTLGNGLSPEGQTRFSLFGSTGWRQPPKPWVGLKICVGRSSCYVPFSFIVSYKLFSLLLFYFSFSFANLVAEIRACRCKVRDCANYTE